MSEKPYQGIKETVKVSGFSAFYLRKRIREGSIPFVRSGNKFLINVPLFLEQMEKEAQAGGRAV